jgi:hypothetical protein
MFTEEVGETRVSNVGAGEARGRGRLTVREGVDLDVL